MLLKWLRIKRIDNGTSLSVNDWYALSAQEFHDYLMKEDPEVAKAIVTSPKLNVTEPETALDDIKLAEDIVPVVAIATEEIMEESMEIEFDNASDGVEGDDLWKACWNSSDCKDNSSNINVISQVTTQVVPTKHSLVTLEGEQVNMFDLIGFDIDKS